MEIFESEERIFNEVTRYGEAVRGGAAFDAEKYYMLVKEYGNLLRKSRNLVEITDETVFDYDEATGIYNRHSLDENLRRIINFLSASRGRLSVLMIQADCDDSGIKQVAEILKGCLKRGDDFVARYSSNMFTVVLPHTGEDGAHMSSNRLLKAIDSGSAVSASIGATTGSVNRKQTAHDYLKRAEEALRISKQKNKSGYVYLNLPAD